jgi:recombination protein RecT
MSDQTAITPYSRFRDILKNDDVQDRFRQLLDKRAPEFLSGLLSLVNAEQKLLSCQPSSILSAAAKAAILRLPIAKELGFAYIVPFKDTATFILGYKGMIQLALRTGQYHAINAAEIYEGEEIIVDRLTGGIKLNGKRTGDTVTGYVAYFKLKNGFEKFIYLSKQDTERHALRYSKSYQYGMNGGKKDSAWFTNFDDMGKKTVLRILLSRYGLMSIEMQDEDAPPLIGNDPRITGEQDIPVPGFDDVLDGHFEETTESEPEPAAVNIYDAVVAAGLSENEFAAKNALAKAKPMPTTGDEAVAWMRAYRGWRDIGADSKKAAEYANKGEMPK